MKASFLYLGIFATLFFTGCSPKNGTVNGNIFIVTEGAQNIKLGLVTVYLLDEQQVQTLVTTTTPIVEKRLTEIKNSFQPLEQELELKKAAIAETDPKYKEEQRLADEAETEGEFEPFISNGSRPQWTIYDAQALQKARQDYAKFGPNEYSLESVEARQNLEKLTDDANDIFKRQKLWDKWRPIYLKHFNESKRLSDELTQLNGRVEQLEDQIKTQKALLKKWLSLNSAAYFENLPDSIPSAKTDADGNFSFSIPRKGRFALAAKAQRNAADNTEEYYWIVWVSLNGELEKKILLSNDNLLTDFSSESAVKLLSP